MATLGIVNIGALATGILAMPRLGRTVAPEVLSLLHVIAPLKVRMMTSWIFMARSTAVAVNTMGTSLAAHGCTPGLPAKRTFHLLSGADRSCAPYTAVLL